MECKVDWKVDCLERGVGSAVSSGLDRGADSGYVFYDYAERNVESGFWGGVELERRVETGMQIGVARAVSEAPW